MQYLLLFNPHKHRGNSGGGVDFLAILIQLHEINVVEQLNKCGITNKVTFEITGTL